MVKTGELLGEMLCAIDFDAMREAKIKFAGVWAEKFFDVSEFSKRAIQKAIELELDRSTGKRILDIGCGFGYLCLAAELFGHRAFGIDIPHPCMEAVKKAVPFEFEPYRIRRMQQLPNRFRPFDLITVIGVNFLEDETRASGWWTEEDYRFFVDDLWGRLSPGGAIQIEHNRGPELNFLGTMDWGRQRYGTDNVIIFQKPR